MMTLDVASMKIVFPDLPQHIANRVNNGALKMVANVTATVSLPGLGSTRYTFSHSVDEPMEASELSVLAVKALADHESSGDMARTLFKTFDERVTEKTSDDVHEYLLGVAMDVEARAKAAKEAEEEKRMASEAVGKVEVQ